MDISVIKSDKTNTEVGIHIGNNDKKILEFINLRCPYCKKWFENSEYILAEAVSDNKLERVIKLLDKDKESLQRGNVMHRFVNTTDANQALKDIKLIFETQEEWQDLSLEEVEKYAINVLDLNEQSHKEYSKDIEKEAAEANIKFVPTIILGEHIFDESISKDELFSLINQ